MPVAYDMKCGISLVSGAGIANRTYPSTMGLFKSDKVYDDSASPQYSDDAATEFQDDRRGSVCEPKVGELHPGEAEEGGLGRHLGLWSTTFLM